VAEVSEGQVAVDTALGRFVVAGEAAPETSVTLSVRPEHVQAGRGGGALVPLGSAQVLESGFFGTHHQCSAALETAERPFKVRLPQKEIPAPGAQLSLWVDPADMVLLTA
jgi:spermidine/putrescine transport system ATP-binding protein